MREHSQILLKICWSGSGSKCQATPCAGALCFPPYREVSDLRQFANPGWTEEPPAQKTEHSVWLDSCGAASLWLCFCLQAVPRFFFFSFVQPILVSCVDVVPHQKTTARAAIGWWNDLSSLREPRLCLTLLEEEPRSRWSGPLCVSDSGI